MQASLLVLYVLATTLRAVRPPWGRLLHAALSGLLKHLTAGASWLAVSARTRFRAVTSLFRDSCR